MLLTLITVPLVMWKGPEAYKQLKVWRAEKLVALAEAAQQKGDFKEAANQLRQATLLVQKHPLTLRAVAQYQVAIQDLSALKTYTALMETGLATTEDKLSFARQAFRLGQPEAAAQVLTELEAMPDIQKTAMLLALRAEQAATKET